MLAHEHFRSVIRDRLVWPRDGDFMPGFLGIVAKFMTLVLFPEEVVKPKLVETYAGTLSSVLCMAGRTRTHATP